MINVKIQGLRELNRNLKKLTGREANNINRAATRAAANEFLKGARRNLPGYHRKKLALNPSRRETSKIRHVFHVGPLAKHWALSFLEFGVPPHEITPRRKKALVNTLGEDLAASSVKHPGVKKLAFLRRSFNDNQQKAIAAFSDKANQRIKKALNR